MDRRRFLAGLSAMPLLAAARPVLIQPALAQPILAQPVPARPGEPRWRRFEITIAVEIAPEPGPARLWLPLPLDSAYQRLEAVTWRGDADALGLYREPEQGAGAFHAAWNGTGRREIALTLRVATTDRAAALDPAPDPARIPDPAAPIPAALAPYLRATALVPTDGIVGETAARIAPAPLPPLERARAIYEWIVDNTFRDPKVKGCGVGDIKAMLESGYLGGKCADLNALFVGLARAAGVPAREVYGIRAAPSALFASLGKGGEITRAQHCRAEFWTAATGWVPADPADIRKVVLEERLALDTPGVAALRRYLFGAWEGNWVAFNTARDLALPPGGDRRLNYFMYPQASTARGALDGMDPDSFRYRIESRELAV